MKIRNRCSKLSHLLSITFWLSCACGKPTLCFQQHSGFETLKNNLLVFSPNSPLASFPGVTSFGLPPQATFAILAIAAAAVGHFRSRLYNNCNMDLGLVKGKRRTNLNSEKEQAEARNLVVFKQTLLQKLALERFDLRCGHFGAIGNKSAIHFTPNFG